MFNLLEIEFYKLKKSKAFYILILLSVAQSLVVGIFYDKLSQHSGKETLAYMFYIQSSLGGNIFVGILSADFIGNEFISGYIKNLICYGHRRRDILIAKSIVYFFGSIIINFTCPVIFALINTMKNGYCSNFTFWEFINLLAIILASIITQIAICSISLLVIFLSKSPNINIGVLIGVDFIFRAMNIVVIHIPSFRNIYDNFILSQFGVISQDNVTISQYLHVFAIGIITIAIFFSITNYFFEKSDI